jgi:hypothetical protein
MMTARRNTIEDTRIVRRKATPFLCARYFGVQEKNNLERLETFGHKRGRIQARLQ